MAKRGADHQMTQLNQNDADNDMSMEGNYQQTGANQSAGRPIARARQRRTAGGARGMMGGGGGGVATPTGSPFTNFNFGANPGAAAAAGGGAATTVNPNIMSPIRNNAANPFVANMAAMNNTPNAPVFGQPNNTGAAAGGGAPGGGTTTFGATAPGSSVFSFSFGQPTGGANNVPASSIFGANAAPTPASIFGQAPATNTGGFGETTPSKPANTMNTGFAAFGQAAPSTPMGTAQNNNNAGGFTFGMTPSNNNQNNASQNNAMDSSTTSFGRPMSVEKPIPSVTFGSNTMDANKPVFGSPTTNTTTSGSGFAFANPGVNPFALNKRDNNAIASTNNGNNTKASNADTTKFTFPSTGGFNFGQTTTNTTTTTGGGGGFTFGSSAATNATDKPFNPFAPKTDASTTTPVKAPAKDTTSGGFSFGIPSSANNNSMATNALGQTEAESKSFHNFSFGTKPSELPDTNAAANNKKMRPGRGFSLEPSTTFGASMNEANNNTTTTTSSTLFGASTTLAKDTTTLSKPFTFGVPTSTTTTTTAAPIATESSKESTPFASIATSTSLTAKGDDSTSKLGEFKPSITFNAASTTTAATQPTFGSFATSFKPATTTTTTTTTNVANASTVTPTLSLTTQDANKSSDISKSSIGSSGFTTLASGTSSTLNTGTTTESTADASKQDAEKEKLQEKYYIELRGLNTSFIEHIQSTVSNNPFADLSDSWDAYQKYYQMIDASLKLIQ